VNSLGFFVPMSRSKNVRGSWGWFTFRQFPSLVAAELLTWRDSRESVSPDPDAPRPVMESFAHRVVKLSSSVVLDSILDRSDSQDRYEREHRDLRRRRSKDGEDWRKGRRTRGQLRDKSRMGSTISSDSL
jgi:hypothetical protein